MTFNVFAMRTGTYGPAGEDSAGNQTDCSSAVLIEADVPFKFCIVQSSEKSMTDDHRSFEYESGFSIAHSEVFWGTT